MSPRTSDEKVETDEATEPAASGKRRLGRSLAVALCMVLSAAAHAGVLGASFVTPGPTEEQAEAERAYALQQFFRASAEREMEDTEAEAVAENEADARVGGPAWNKEGGTGTRAKGEEGSMGAPSIADNGSRYGVQGPSEDPHIARAQAMKEAAEFGMIGLLNSGAGGDPSAPTAPWGRDDSLGNQPLAARGNQWGASIGDSFGAGGVGLDGIGEGGGGRGEGIGLGSIGTIGHGAGPGSGQGFGSGAGNLGGAQAGAGQGFGAGAGRLGGAGGSAPPQAMAAAPMPAPEPVREERIDPNGRFATTYRPGGGHLAAFESAVARGILPAADREVVSDVGARFVPQQTLAEDRSMAMAVELERAQLSPSGGPVHVRIALQGTPDEASERPHLSVHLVLDVSGSMEGQSMERARQAALELVRRLDANDDFSLVTFSSGADVLVEDGPVGARRSAIERVIRDVHTDGGTNIGEGLRLGYEQAQSRAIPEDAVRVVLLLSDGRANAGITDRSALSRLALDAFQHDVQTSTFGLGTDYDGELMSAVASDGAGGYYYLRDAEQISAALGTELDKRLDPVATAVEVRVRLKEGVDLLKVYGSRRLGQMEAARVRAIEVAADKQAEVHEHIASDRKDDAEGGMRFLIPAFAKGDSHAMLLKLALPAGVGDRRLATIELKYKDRVHGRNVVEEMPLSIGYADSDAASARTASPSVARTVQAFVAGETLMTAAALVGRGDREGAAALLYEREQIVREAASSLSEPLLLREATRLARLRQQASPAGEISEPLALAVLLETAGRSRLR